MKDVPGTEYIGRCNSHNHTYFNVQRRVNGKYRFFGSGKTLIEALMIKDWVEAHNWEKKYPKEVKCDEKYIYQKNSGTYTIQKQINGKLRYYGGFDNLEDAIRYRDFIICKGWSSNYIYKNPMQGIQKRNNNYQVFVYLGGKNEYVGTFKTLEHAFEVRQLFIKYNGDWDLICEGFENKDEESEWLNGIIRKNSFFDKPKRGLSDSFWATRGAHLYDGARL